MKNLFRNFGILMAGLLLILQPFVVFGQLATPTMETTTTTATAPEHTSTMPTTEPAPDTTPPIILSITAISVDPGQTNVVWTTDKLSYGWVEFGPTISYGAQTAQSGPSLEHIAMLTGLDVGSEYHYRIVAVDEAGNKTYYESHTFVTASEPVFVDETPPSITSVEILDTSTSSATFSIATDEPAITKIEYGTTENYGSFTPSSSEFDIAHITTIANLKPGTVYHYRVIAEDEAGNATASFDDTFTTDSLPVVSPSAEPTSSEPLAIIQPEAVVIGTSTVTIAWSTNKDADGRIDYGATNTYGLNISTTTQALSHRLTLKGLSPGTAYLYQITARTASGEIVKVGELEFTTLPQVIAPAETGPVLSGITAHSVAASTATISWNTDTLADSTVRYGTTTAYEAGAAHDATLKNSHEIFLANLMSATTYHFEVISADALKNTAISKDFTFTTASSGVTSPPIASTSTVATSSVKEPAIPPQNEIQTGTPNLKVPEAARRAILATGAKIPDLPSTPRVLKTEGLDGQAAFIWNTAGAPSTFQVRVVRNTSNSPGHENDGVVVYEGRAGAFTDTNLNNGQTYHYAIYITSKFRGISEPHRVVVTPTLGNDQVSLQAVSSEIQLTPTFTFENDLGPGAQSRKVAQLQLLLAEDANIYPQGLITSYFGALTQNALRRFQKQNNLPATGFADAPTRAALEAESSRPALILQSPFSRELSLDSEGSDVAALQMFLHDAGYYPEALFTGYFGPLTQAALVKFQSANAIRPASGYFGPVSKKRVLNLMRLRGVSLP
ncbi:MAG: peptidoglycan-binding protein [Patescibacteria group bacterium]|nr:peptidoglycan-binding protein [Patescibacteria group bacterium]MDE2015667.1 peptidoglycan-binding protein [Patescibacteria group bacterium]MDE2226724.1 peptidoglycan-binding protein [Patescibacteria group bacterium]